MPTDPRLTLRQYFDPSSGNCKIIGSNLLLEDGVTQANYEANYELSEADLEKIFKDAPDGLGIDLLFIIKKLSTELEAVQSPSGPIGYYYNIGIQPVAVDKWSGTTKKVDGTKLLWKAISEIERIIRTYALGSMKVVRTGTPENEILGSTIIWGDTIEVRYLQYVTAWDIASGTSRFFGRIKELKIGVSSSVYTSMGGESGLHITWIDNNPIVTIPIPGASSGVDQLIGNYGGEGTIIANDYGKLYTLLYSTNIDGSGNKAYSETTRNTIGYFAVVYEDTTINRSSDARTVGTLSLVFSEVKIENIDLDMNNPAAPMRATFKYNSKVWTYA